jgi:hypothetical protein
VSARYYAVRYVLEPRLFLGLFGKMRKAAVSFFMPDGPYGTTRLSQEIYPLIKY